jgi:hypothetical protein
LAADEQALFMRNAGLTSKTMVAVGRGCILSCAIAALVAGCGLQEASHSGQPGGPGTSRGHQHSSQGTGVIPGSSGTPSMAVRECTFAEVQVKLDARATGVAAGSSYIPLDFTNVSPARCRLAGFPQVTIAASSAGKQIGAAAAADRSATARGTILADGQTAHIWLRVASIANIPSAQCRPVAAAGLRIALPGQSQTTFIGHPLTTCAKQVRGTDVLTVEPFRPGIARAGSAR